MERKHWIDNLRWVTVLLVLFYHVIYFYNAKGVFGGIGGFYEVQPWDALMSLLYPWFMMLLFLVAGISSKYALGSAVAGPVEAPHTLSHRQFIRSRTRKLLVPSTIGLLVFQWMVGYFNTVVAARQGVFDGVPAVGRYFIMAFSGIGPLWFVQDLWLFSMLLVLFRVIGKGWLDRWLDRMEARYEEASIPFITPVLAVSSVLLFFGAQFLVMHPRPASADGLWNLYRPVTYFVLFLLGYYVFSRDYVQEMVAKLRIGSLVFAIGTGVAYTIVNYGKNDTDPLVLRSVLCNVFAWFAILAMLGCFKAWADKTSPFAAYMTRNSYGVYIVHYLVIASFGYMMKTHTTLAPWMQYAILFVAVMTIPFALNEIIKRIPFVRWCVLGIKQSNSK